MRGFFPSHQILRNVILTLVLEVGADGQDGATESAGPRLVIDVAVSRRQETGAMVASERALSCTHAHTAVQPVRLPKLQGRAGPEFKHVLASVGGGLIRFPKTVAGGLSSVFRGERRWFRPGLVRTGGWKSCRPPNARRARRRRLRRRERRGFGGGVVEDVLG